MIRRPYPCVYPVFPGQHSDVRAKRKKHIPTVLTRTEVDLIISKLHYPYDLIAKLLYGCGLRLFEYMNLRMQCLNLDEAILIVHDGKGQKGRSVPLPKTIMSELLDHIETVKLLHDADLDAGFDGVFMPRAFDKKSPGVSKEFAWQWLFPAKLPTFVPETNKRSRYHLHDTHVQKAIHTAVKRSKLRVFARCLMMISCIVMLVLPLMRTFWNVGHTVGCWRCWATEFQLPPPRTRLS